MIYVNYWIKDMFNNEQFINAKEDATPKSIRTAFKAIKKYNGALFVDIDNDTQIRYKLKHPYSDSDLLEKTTLTHFYKTIPDSEVPILIDYNTALKQELKKVKWFKMKIYILVPTKLKDKITDSLLMNCGEKYGVFTSYRTALDSIPGSVPYDAFVPIEILGWFKMKVKDYVEQCTSYDNPFDFDLFRDPHGNFIQEIIEERKLDSFTMRYYTTHYLIDGVKYAPDDEI